MSEDAGPNLYRIRGSELAETCCMYLDDEQAADLRRQGYWVDAVRSDLSSEYVHQSSEMYAAYSRIRALGGLVHEFMHYPVTCHWTLADRVADPALVQRDRFAMLVEDIRTSVVQRTGKR